MGATGVVIEAATAEEEDISHIVLVEGAFYPNCSTRSTVLTVYIAGDAVGDSKLQPTKVPSYARRNASPLLLCIYAIPCIRHRIRLYITERLINLNKVRGQERVLVCRIFNIWATYK